MSNLNDVDWSQIPAPIDDGGTDHLLGLELPAITLPATDGISIELDKLTGINVVYAYPMTGRPDVALPDGWDNLPGARGCTPQSCEFRDHAIELADLGVENIFGLSTQTTDYQREAAERLHLPFVLLSDNEFALTNTLQLPTMDVDGNTLLKRFTLIVTRRKITKVFYPIFPPSENASQVIDWLKEQ